MKKELIAHKDPKSPVSETFRTLRTNIQFMNSNKELKTLLITSTVPGEGKSWIASNLAVAFAQAGKKVVLIDADMRKGRLYNIFGVLPRPGLSNYLSGISEINQDRTNLLNYIRETEVPNLYIMPAGNIPPNPSELLITSRMTELLEKLKQESDLIIIDATPSKLVTDAVILSRIVDSTIIVTAHNQTKKDDLDKVTKDIKNVGGNVIGVVYNKIPISTKKYNQTYYYASRQSNTQAKARYEKQIKEEVGKITEDIAKIDEQNKTVENINENQEINKKEQTYTEINTETPTTYEQEEIVKPIGNIEVPKGVQNNIDESANNVDKTAHEKTEEILKEFNEYLKREKRMKYNK